VSPKKKRKTRDRRPREGSTTEPVVRTRREPVVVERSRWPVLVWIVLAAVWAIGTPMFLVFLLAEAFAAADAQETSEELLRVLTGHLLGLVLCALAAPLAGTVTALVLRRRIAAVLFGACLLVSLVGLWVWWAPPWELIATLWSGLLG
jgi:hypothetical protein